jgi:cytochrome c-type biogenesis protein
MIGALGSSAPGVLAALAGGLLSFLSPCVLPLVPVYLSIVTGESPSDIRAGRASRSRVFGRTLLFVAGFTLVFTALALAFGGGMRFIGGDARQIVNRVAGIVVIALALNVLFDFVPFLRAELRMNRSSGGTAPDGATSPVPPTGRATLFAALKPLVAGMAFAAGWTPCVGPILSSILLLSGESGDPVRAATLLLAYSIGLAIPFVFAGFFLGRAQALFAFFKRHHRAVTLVTGLLLLVFGITLLAGGLSRLPAILARSGYVLADFAETGPAWLKPVAAFISRWLLFQGA